MDESAEFEQQQQAPQPEKKRLPVVEALIRHPCLLKIIALRLCELLTMYIVTAFALNYSTQNLGLPRELFLNIGLLVGGLSCLTIPCFAGSPTALVAGAFTLPAHWSGRSAHSRSLWR